MSFLVLLRFSMPSAAVAVNQLELSLHVLFFFTRTTTALLLDAMVLKLSLHSLFALFSFSLKTSFLLLLSTKACCRCLFCHVFSCPIAVAFAECSCTCSSGMFQNQLKLFLHSLLCALLCSHAHSKGTHCLRSYCCCCYEQCALPALSAYTVFPFSCRCCCCYLTGITLASL